MEKVHFNYIYREETRSYRASFACMVLLFLWTLAWISVVFAGSLDRLSVNAKVEVIAASAFASLALLFSALYFATVNKQARKLVVCVGLGLLVLLLLPLAL
jgi:uncharacterized membrane-anchored protein